MLDRTIDLIKAVLSTRRGRQRGTGARMLRGTTAVHRRRAGAAAVAGLVAVLFATSLASAETAKERRQRREEEKKQRAEEKAEQRRKEAERKAYDKARREQAAAKLVKYEEHGFQFRTVNHWMAADGGLQLPGAVGCVLYLGPKVADPDKWKSMLTLRVLPVAEGKGLDDVVAQVTKELNCHGPHYKVEPGEALDVGGEPGRTLVFEPNDASVKDTKPFVALAQHGDKAYVFMLMTIRERFDAERAQAEKMIGSTKWLDGKPTAKDLAAKAPKAEKAKPAKATSEKAKPKGKAKADDEPAAKAKAEGSGTGDETPPAAPAAPAPAEGDGLD